MDPHFATGGRLGIAYEDGCDLSGLAMARERVGYEAIGAEGPE
jgi:hypothetical protein